MVQLWLAHASHFASRAWQAELCPVHSNHDVRLLYPYRRDLAVLLLHAGQPAAAAAELSAYLASIRTQRGRQDVQEDPFGVKLAHDLWKMLAESGVQPAR